MLFLIGVGLGVLLGYFLTRPSKQIQAPPPVDYAALRRQAAAEIDLWVDKYPEAERHVVRGIASNMRNGVLPHPAVTPPQQHVVTQQQQVVSPVVKVQRDSKDDAVSILAYLGAIVVVAGITVFSVQAEGGLRFLLLVCMSAMFYAGGLLLRSVVSLKNVANTFLAIGLIAAPFAMLSLGSVLDAPQSVIAFMSSLVCMALYGITAMLISSALLQYVFLASVFVTGQTATATITTDFSWFMLTLSLTGLLVAVVRRVFGDNVEGVDRVALLMTQGAAVTSAALSILGLTGYSQSWPIVVMTLLVSAGYFYYSGKYECVRSGDQQTSWIVAQTMVVMAVALGAGFWRNSLDAAVIAILLAGVVYSVSLPFFQLFYDRRKTPILQKYHVATICFLPVFGFVLSLDDEKLRLVALAAVLVQYAALQVFQKYQAAAYGWTVGALVAPLAVFDLVATVDNPMPDGVYALAYGAFVALFLWLWLRRSSASTIVSPYNMGYGIALVALFASALFASEQVMVWALLWIAASLAVATWRTRAMLLPSLALSSVFAAFCVETAHVTTQPVAVPVVLFVVAVSSYMVARAFKSQFGDAWTVVGLEFRSISLAAVAMSIFLSLGADAERMALLSLYALAVLMQIEAWLHSQTTRELSAALFLVSAWWTLGYNGVDNILAYTYAAAAYATAIAYWHRMVTNGNNQTYRSLSVAAGLLAGIPIALAALTDKDTYALLAILQNVLLVIFGLLPELKPLRWIGFWTIVALISLQLLTYGFLFLWFVGAVLIGLAIFMALRHNQPPSGK